MSEEKVVNSEKATAKPAVSVDEEVKFAVEDHLSAFKGVTPDEVDRVAVEVQEAINFSKQRFPKRTTQLVFLTGNKQVFAICSAAFKEVVTFGAAMDKAKNPVSMTNAAATLVQKKVIYPKLDLEEIKEGGKVLNDGDAMKLFMQIQKASGVNDEIDVKNV